MRRLESVSTPSALSPATHSSPHYLIPHQGREPYSSPTHSCSLLCSHDPHQPFRTQVNHHLLRETLSLYSSEVPSLLFALYHQAHLYCTSRWEVCLVHYAPSAGILLGTKWMLNKHKLMTDWRAQEKNQVGVTWKNKSQRGSSP